MQYTHRLAVAKKTYMEKMMMRIAQGSRVTVLCRVVDGTGVLLDDGQKPFTFVCGKGQAIAGLERALEGKERGYRGAFDVAPEDAYGIHRPELVFEAVRENLPEGMDIQPGMNLSSGGSDGRFQLKVVALTERGAVLDGNHPLAGKRLAFDVEVLKVERATESMDA